MIQKFMLWATGLIIVTLLAVTAYGVVTGSLQWEKYLALWTGLVGLVIGRISKEVAP